MESVSPTPWLSCPVCIHIHLHFGDSTTANVCERRARSEGGVLISFNEANQFAIKFHSFWRIRSAPQLLQTNERTLLLLMVVVLQLDTELFWNSPTPLLVHCQSLKPSPRSASHGRPASRILVSCPASCARRQKAACASCSSAGHHQRPPGLPWWTGVSVRPTKGSKFQLVIQLF